MPALSSNASIYRAGRHFFTGHVAIIPQTVVHSGTLSATPTFPAQAISISTTGGTSASVRRGMTIRIETSGGVLKGILRVATSGTISNATLPINETSQGTVNLASGDVFKVIDEYRIFDALVSNTSALNKDSRVTVSDNTSNPPPIPNAGGLWAGFVDDGQTYATVSFDASVSINVDPDSSTTKTYSWTVGAGATITVGSATTAAITVQFPVGFRHVVLTVTDSGNSKSATRLIPVWVYNRSTTLPLAISQAQIDYSHDDGHSAQFQLPKGSESGITTLPDGSLVVFFVDEYYSGTRGSYGSNVSGRSHIHFVGFLQRDSVSIEPENNTVSFDAISPLGVLNKTPALPQLMVQNASPTKWRHIKTLSTNRMLHYVSWWHDTVSNIFDFVWQLTGTSFGYRRIAISEATSIGAQLRDIAQSINLKVTCDRLGRILFIQDFDYLSTANRSSRTVLYNFTTADFKNFEFTREHLGTVKYIEGQGITDGTIAGSNKPCFSSSPGKAPSSFGTGSDTLARQIVDNQTDLNNRTGWHYARLNGLYSGRFVPQDARLTLPSGYSWIDPAYNEPITVTTATTTNKRGVAFDTTTRWLVDSTSRTYDAETGIIENVVTAHHETDGIAGVTKVKAQQSQNGLPPYPPIDLTNPPPIITPTTEGLVTGTDTLAVFPYNATSMLLMTNFTYPAQSGGPTVTQVALGLSGGFQSVVVDPWSPKYLGTGTAVNVWVATTSRLYTITDLFGTRTATQRLVFTSTPTDAVVTRVLATERGVQNFVICASYYAGTAGKEGTWIARTTDGTTWSEAQLTAFYNSAAANQMNQRTPTAWVSAKIPGRCYAFAFTATGVGVLATSRLYKSDDYGANWSLMSGFTNRQSLGYCLHVPWHNNPNDRYIFWTRNNAGGTGLQLMRTDTTTGTDTVLDLVAPAGTGIAGSWPHSISIASSDINRNYMLVAGARFNSNHFATAVYSSSDGGDSWRQQTDEVDAANERITGVRYVPNSTSAAYISGEDSQEMGYTNYIPYALALSMYIDNKYNVSASAVGIVGG